MELLEKNQKNYTRVYRRCQKLFYTTSKFSKICPNCDGSPEKTIKSKFIFKEMKVH